MIRVSSKYFSDQEIICKGRPKCGCSGKIVMNPVFDQQLLALREKFGQPMKVNSCLRCKAYNASLGDASARSLHVYDQPAYPTQGGAAIDISTVLMGDDGFALAQIAWDNGFAIGVGSTFLHLDSRHHLKILPQVMFFYDNTPKERRDKFALITK